MDRNLRDELRGLIRSLRTVQSIQLDKQLFRTVQLHSNNAFYRFLLKLCELIHDEVLSSEDHGPYLFRDFLRDSRQMAALFEAFVYNFYRRECPLAEVKSERIYWDASSEDDPELTFLPSMETDISLRTAYRTLIVDTKFYQETLQLGLRTRRCIPVTCTSCFPT